MNIYDYKSEKKPQEELVTVLLENDTVKIERIVSKGEVSPDGFYYDQEWDEWLTLLSGNAEIEINNDLKKLTAGDTFFIPRRTLHRVTYTDTSADCIWLCIFIK